MRVLSLAYDILFFSSLAILIVGFAGNEVLLSIIFALAGIIQQAFFLRRFRSKERWHRWIPFIGPVGTATALAKTKNCRSCERTISADAKICRYCLTSVDEVAESSAQITPRDEAEDLQLQIRRWQAATDANS